MIIAMLFICCSVNAVIYTFVTNSGTFIFNERTNTISFKGTTYQIIDAGRLSNGDGPNYFECKSGNTTKLIVLNLPDDNIIEFDYVETFEWKDVALYDKAKLVSGLYRNIETYIYNENIRGELMVLFRKYAGIMLQGIQNGTITMNNNGTFTDSTGQLSSNGSFDKTWLGKKKNTANNAILLVANYITDYIKQMPTRDSCWEPVGKPYLILKANKSE
jgi:hypothetical protein